MNEFNKILKHIGDTPRAQTRSGIARSLGLQINTVMDAILAGEEASLVDGADLAGDPFTNPDGRVCGFELTTLGKALVDGGEESALDRLENAAWLSLRKRHG